MSRTPCISWPWCCKWPTVSRQPRESTAHGSTLQDTVLDCPTCQPQRVGGISALKAQQLICSCVHGFLPPSPAQQQRETGCLSCSWGGQWHFPATLEPRAAMWGAAASPPEVVVSLASLLGGLKPGNGAFASCQKPTLLLVLLSLPGLTACSKIPLSQKPLAYYIVACVACVRLTKLGSR